MKNYLKNNKTSCYANNVLLERDEVKTMLGKIIYDGSEKS